MRWRRLVGPALAVAGVAFWRRWRRRPPRGVSGLRAVAAVALVSGWWPWDPIVRVFGSVTQAIRDFVAAAIDEVAAWVQSGLDALRDLVNWVHDSLASWISQLVDWLGQRIEGVMAFARQVWDELYSWAAASFAAVGRQIDNVWDRLYGWASAAIGALGRTVEGFYGWVIDHVWDPLTQAVHEVYSWADRNIYRPIMDRLTDLWHDTYAELRGIWDKLYELWRWFIDEAYDAVKFAGRMAVQLGRFVADPLEWMSDHIGRLISGSARWFVGQFTQAITDEADSIEESLARFIGGI